VALVRIYNACLKCAAGGSLQIQDAKITQKFHLHTIAQLCRATSSQVRHVSTTGKNLLTALSAPHVLTYGELRPTNGWHRLVSLGHPSKFQRVSRLGFVTALTTVNQTLHDVWPSPALVHYTYIFVGACPLTEFC